MLVLCNEMLNICGMDDEFIYNDACYYLFIIGVCKSVRYLCKSVIGVPKPTSEMSLRAPAQMGRREAEREGGT
jgi:hypothetical protein